MPARRQEGVPAIPTAKERDFRQGCITPPVRGSIWRRCGSLWRCSPAFAAAFPVASSVCTSFNPDRPVAFLPVCPRAGRQAQGQAGMQAEGQGCQPDGRKACRPFRPQRKGTFAELMSLCPCVAAFGADVVACGVPQPLSDPDLPPTFAPKRQGNAPGAYRRPRLRPSFGQPEGIGRPFGLLPKRPCPLRGGASSPKSGSLFSYLRCGCRKLRLGRETTKSIVI